VITYVAVVVTLALAASPALAFGSNAGVRLAAEIPFDRGLVLSFLLGMDFHLSGFDTALAMPLFAVRVGYAL
jgi:hypothetical protein